MKQHRWLAAFASALLLVAAAATPGLAGSPSAANNVSTRYQWLLTSPRWETILSGGAEAALRHDARVGNNKPGSGPSKPSGGGSSTYNGKLGATATLSCDAVTSSAYVNNDTTSSKQTTQSEVSVAVGNGYKVVGYNNSTYTTSTYDSYTGFSYFDGSNWYDCSKAFSAAVQPTGYQDLGDPVVQYDASTGTFYLSQLAYDPSGVSVVALSQITPHAGGSVDVTLPATANYGTNSSHFMDKEWIAVGPGPVTGKNSVYITWTDFPSGGNNSIRFARFDPGNGFTTSAVIASGSVQGSAPVVDGNGNVYVALEAFGNFSRAIYEVTSASAYGNSWNSPAAVASVAPASNQTVLCGSQNREAFPSGSGGAIRILEFPSQAYYNGNLYLGWNDGNDGNSNVRIYTAAAGASPKWSPLYATTSSLHEFMPAVAADANGVHVLYYTLSPNTTNSGMDQVTTTVATVGGTSSTVSTFYADQNNPNFDPVVANCYMGDYNGITSTGTGVFYGYGDNGTTLNSAGYFDPNVKVGQ